MKNSKTHRKAGKKQKETSDFGTPELQQHHAVVVEAAGLNVGRVRIRVTDGCELDRLLAGEYITNDQHNAGTKLSWDLDRAGGKRSCIASLNGPMGGGESGGKFVYAIGRVSSAVRQLQVDVGRETVRLVISIIWDEAKISSDSQLEVLRLGLNSLSNYYATNRHIPTSLR
jgi:hypothetical protein